MANHTGMLTVDGTPIKTPSSMTIDYQDVSTSDAGRTQDALMHKNLISRKVKMALSWSNPSPEDAHTILRAFYPEYFNVTYYDPLEGDTVTKRFYSGDKSAPVKIWTANNKRYETISFDIIER